MTTSFTPQQEQAIRNLYARSDDDAGTFHLFHLRFNHDSLNDCVMGQWHGMWIGIEKDGYTHS